MSVFSVVTVVYLDGEEEIFQVPQPANKARLVFDRQSDKGHYSFPPSGPSDLVLVPVVNVRRLNIEEVEPDAPPPAEDD